MGPETLTAAAERAMARMTARVLAFFGSAPSPSEMSSPISPMSSRREISAVSGATASRTSQMVVASDQERAVRLPLTYAVRTEALSRSRA